MRRELTAKNERKPNRFKACERAHYTLIAPIIALYTQPVICPLTLPPSLTARHCCHFGTSGFDGVRIRFVSSASSFRRNDSNTLSFAPLVYRNEFAHIRRTSYKNSSTVL